MSGRRGRRHRSVTCIPFALTGSSTARWWRTSVHHQLHGCGRKLTTLEPAALLTCEIFTGLAVATLGRQAYTLAQFAHLTIF